MEEKLKEFREYINSRLDSEYNLLEEDMVLREILTKFDELFELN